MPHCTFVRYAPQAIEFVHIKKEIHLMKRTVMTMLLGLAAAATVAAELPALSSTWTIASGVGLMMCSLLKRGDDDTSLID